MKIKWSYIVATLLNLIWSSRELIFSRQGQVKDIVTRAITENIIQKGKYKMSIKI